MAHFNTQLKSFASNSAESGYRLLLVDDDEATLQATSLALTAKGFNIITACDGIEALTLVEQHEFDGIILDALMPELDGFRTCQALRHILNDANFPIIIATGLDDSGSIDKAFKSGATDYITKPLNFQILSSRLNVIFDSIAESNKRSSQNLFTKESLQESADYVIEINSIGEFCNLDAIQSLPESFRQSLQNSSTISAYLNRFKIENQLVMELLESNPERFFSERFTVVEHLHQGSRKYEMQLFKHGSADYFLAVSDLTEQYISENRLKKLVNYDPVTHLPNASYFLSQLSKWRLRLAEVSNDTAVVNIALTNLSKCELKLRSSSVIQLLKRISSLLSQELKQHSDCFLISRYSNDTFAFSVKSISREKLELLINNIREKLSGPFELRECSLRLTFSIGAFHGSLKNYTAKEMLRNSSISMNANSSDSKDFQFYNPQLQQDLNELTKMENALRRDLAAEKLDVHFQPKFNIENMTLCGAEALIRWESEEFGFVSPARFIPIAEVNDMMEQLGKLVIKKTISYLHEWKNTFTKAVPISINLDVKTLSNRQFIDDFIDQLDNMKIERRLIEIEVTESIMAEANSKAIDNIDYLQKSGIKISMDDFGTGYSCFSYLKDLPLDVLKIDMSFINNIHLDSAALSIVKAIIEVGHSLKLQVVAEGVEDKLQLDLLKKLNCDTVQGYLTGKPMSALAFGDILSEFANLHKLNEC